MAPKPPAESDAGYQEALRRIHKAKRQGGFILNLSDLKLTTVPPEIGQLQALQTLHLFDNQLTTLPPEIGQLQALRRLDLENNQLTTLPREIGQLQALQLLDLNNNQLETLPPEIGQLQALRILAVENNQLTSLPPQLRALRKLQSLYLHGNSKLQLPVSVLGNTYWEVSRENKAAPKPKPILDYYFKSRLPSQRQILGEAKLILVGRGESGKTSLVRRLVEHKFSRREDTTQGIRIRKWPVTVGGRKKQEVLLHIWDFGGQEIMHATHQFFLTDRSLYLLVLDGRAGQQEAEADYWLRMIASFAPESPVLVVLNKIKKDHFTLNRAALVEKYPQVKGFIETDCDNPGPDGKPGPQGYGLDKLERQIKQHVAQLPDVFSPFPLSWFTIKDKLSRSRKSYLTIDEYRKLCHQHGEPDAESQDHLSLFLHRLGIALNFSDDERLNDKHVLNPHWLTNGIYRLLNSKRIAQQQGVLQPTDLAQELPAKEYPQEMHPFLLGLMQKFELCFSYPDENSRYLIPELLDPEQPPDAKEFQPPKCLNFHYEYPVLPPGLLPRFIVRTHVLSDLNEQHRWRTGVILQFEGSSALIKADPQEKLIHVRIHGGNAQSRERMLAMIRQEFDVIHRDIPHLRPAEMVSFPDHPEIAEKFTDLVVRYKQDPNSKVSRVVNGTVIEMSVRELLEGVEFAPLEQARLEPPGEIPSLRDESDAPVRVFFSYSHVDAKQRGKLAKHLAPLERIGLIKLWYDREIPAGVDWEAEIAEQLNECELVLLLISSDFTASNYCVEIEMQRAMERRRAKEAEVIPIIIRKINAWTKVPAGKEKLGGLNALPTGAKEIPRWNPQDEGWANVAAGIQAVAEHIRKQRPKKRR